MKAPSFILGASVLALGILATTVQATQILYRSPKQLGQESSLVVQGKVAAVRSYWNDRHTKILTETTVTIDQTYKGERLSAVRIVQLGGTVGTVKVTVHGALEWRRGEEVLVFLEPLEAGTFQVSGFSQGKFEIERDPVSGEAFLKHAPSRGVEMVGMTASGKTPAGGAAAGRTSLRRFLDEALGLR